MKIITFLATMFTRPRRQVIEIPAVCGRRRALSEAKATLQGQHENDTVQTLLWIIVGKRQRCADAAQMDAHRNQDTRFQLGAKQATDDLLNDIFDLLDGRTDTNTQNFDAD